MDSKDVYLSNIHRRIEGGEFDKKLILPFMNRKLLFNLIKRKINKRFKKGKTPNLTDTEINMIIGDMKELSGYSFKLFVEYGFIEQDDENNWQISEKGKKAILESLKI